MQEEGGEERGGVGELHTLPKEKKASLLNLDKLHKLYMVYIYIYILYIYIYYIYTYIIYISYICYTYC